MVEIDSKDQSEAIAEEDLAAAAALVESAPVQSAKADDLGVKADDLGVKADDLGVKADDTAKVDAAKVEEEEAPTAAENDQEGEGVKEPASKRQKTGPDTEKEVEVVPVVDPVVVPAVDPVVDSVVDPAVDPVVAPGA